MLNFSRAKIWSIWLTCIVGVLLAVPSFLPASITDSWPAVLRPKVNLGLDLAGGSQLLLEADPASLLRQRLEAMEGNLRDDLRRNGIQVADVSTANNQIILSVQDPAQRDAALQRARALADPTGTNEYDVSPLEANRVVMVPTAAGNTAAMASAMESARNVIDIRINALGTLEPTIVRQGDNRILVQVPGLQDPQALKNLIGRTARLEFKRVNEAVPREQLEQNRAPAGSQILPMQGGGRIAVERRPIITGEMVADARQAFDQQTNVPVVTIKFDSTGGQRFARETQQRVGKQFAIILDNIVLSAPSINEPILGGSAQITGNFTVESANALAISLRSGRLPVELKVVEERSVGPDLGEASIKAGVLACAIATIAVLILMFLCYGRFGIYANLAVLINLFVIVGVMALMNATLTLPGIAGFVLTVGTAVDANVLINERIREERRRGRSIIMAIENGYKEASRTIFEANVIHAISAVIMLILGSGPVKGFAIVLLVGIITSVFTAVVFTRMMIVLWLRRHKPADLHI
jgi:preprotein translocase subunit SecD